MMHLRGALRKCPIKPRLPIRRSPREAADGSEAEAKSNRAGAKPQRSRVAAADSGSHGFESEFEGALANAAEGFFVHI
jgi:hypothetical protein